MSSGCDQAGIYSQGHTTTIRNNLLENNCIGIYLSSAPTLVAQQYDLRLAYGGELR